MRRTHGHGHREPEPLSGFQEMVAADVHNVFLNVGEFARRRTIKYDGKTYEDIPVVLEGPATEARERLTNDCVLGLHKVTAVLYCAQADLDGKLPAHGYQLEVDRKKYYIVASASSMGMLYLELEAIRQ